MIAAAIFDMDGLLLDSEPLWRRANIAVCAEYGISITENDVRQMAGRRTLDIARLWLERANKPQDHAEALAQEVTTHVIGQIKTEGKLLPGAREAVQLFRQHQLPVAIASSSSPKVIAAVIRQFELEPYIKFAHSAVDEVRGKPFPDVFLATAKTLAIKPEHCVVFEDAVSGVVAAKAAGMWCVAVPELVNRHLPEFKAADLQLDSLTELKWASVEKFDSEQPTIH